MNSISHKKIPYLDLSVKSDKKRKQLLHVVDKLLQHGRIVEGPEQIEFESVIAELCNSEYALGVGSGSDALYLALRAIDLGPGDEVIVSPLSWIATVNAIVLCGATPVFVDIDNDLNIDVNLIEAAITDNTKVILPVHYTGRMCNMDAINLLAKKYSIFVVEDAAQAFGASYNGIKAGSSGHIGAMSMNPMKVLSAYGEAGIVLTDDENIAESLKSLRYAGVVDKTDCITPSINAKMDTLQAAMLLVELEYIDQKIARRREIAKFYNERLTNKVECPIERTEELSVYYNYVIQTGDRESLMNYLNQKNIETKIHYPILMPQHTAFKNQYGDCQIPVAQSAVKKIISIPSHENLTDADIEYVADSIISHFN